MEKLKELADKMYSSAQYLSTDASRLRKAMKDYHDFVIYEYPKVKKDLTLTWEDMKWIHDMAETIARQVDTFERPIYEEVLRRFNEQRK